MGRKNCWFTYVKRLFIPQPKPKSVEKSKKWRWIFRRFKFRQHPAIEQPEKALNEATEQQKRHALTVAVATAAAAEAAVAAANAAAEVVRLTNIPQRGLRLKNQHCAAIKIQSAYRRHLARKALSALKGLVKLQAVIRGELVRRSVVKRLASTALLVKFRPRADQKRVPCLLEYLNQSENRHSLRRKEGTKSFPQERRNDQSLQELMSQKESSRSSRLDQYVEHTVSQPRRSFCHVKHRSIGDDGSLPSSPVFPAYMAATASAKARSRSLSTPKQRLRLYETYSGDHSPHNLRLFSWSSFNSKIAKRNSISQHISSGFETLN